MFSTFSKQTIFFINIFFFIIHVLSIDHPNRKPQVPYHPLATTCCHVAERKTADTVHWTRELKKREILMQKNTKKKMLKKESVQKMRKIYNKETNDPSEHLKKINANLLSNDLDIYSIFLFLVFYFPAHLFLSMVGRSLSSTWHRRHRFT